MWSSQYAPVCILFIFYYYFLCFHGQDSAHQSPKRGEASSRRLASPRLGRSEARRGEILKLSAEARRGEAREGRGEAKRFRECRLDKVSSIFFIEFLSLYLVKRRILYSLDEFPSCLLQKVQNQALLWCEEFDYLDLMFIFKFKTDEEGVQKII
jgi:hypothetical protein